MAIKKSGTKTVKSQIEDPESAPENEKKQERKVPVTQVVEVIEDDSPLESSVTAENRSGQSPVDNISVTDTSSVEPAEGANEIKAREEEPSATSDEKRKELVDELFQKRIDKPEKVAPEEITMHTSKKPQPVYLWAVGIITACVVAGVSLFFLSGKKMNLPSVASAPTPTPTPVASTPTPTPAQLKRDTLTIQVLNGGGKSGAATKMKKTLEDKGYTVKDTGNAEAYTYDKTEIHVKPSKKEYIPLLETDLKDSYTLGTSVSTLEDSVAYDVRIIVGKE